MPHTSTPTAYRLKLSPKSLVLNPLFFLLLLLAACGQPAAPTATPSLVPSLTASPTEDIAVAVEGTLTAMATAGPTATDITLTPTPSPESTDDSIRVTLPALADEEIPPPLDITLPPGWGAAYNVHILQDVDNEYRGFPFAIYHGAVTGGAGTIVLYWGFPNLNMVASEDMAGSMIGTPLAADIWSDGLRLLNLAVVEQGCVVGTDLRRTYRIGLLSAVGTQFSAVDCPELPNTRGWFAGVQEKGLNFVFYAFVEGEDVMSNTNLDAFNAATRELQAILDTVRFRVPDVVPTASPIP
jgi:hypothetical protein